MPRDLFGAVTSPPVALGNRKWYTVPLSLAAHVAVIVPIILVPLLATDILPLPIEYDVFVSPLPTPPEPPPPVTATTAKTKPAPNPDAAPLDAPASITPELSIQSDFRDPANTGVDDVITGGNVIGSEPPPPPPPVTSGPPKPVPVGGNIRPPQKIHDALPRYPAIAQAARVQGTVILQATIGVDGRVENLRVLRSIPLLDQSAVDAVQQWEYAATLLNGVPVSVIMTVTVTFSLAGK